jgi:hypothetical protein
MTEQEIFEKDLKLADTAIELARFSAARSDFRANYEWKLTFSLWAVLLTIIVKGLADAPAVGAAMILLVYGWWLQHTWIRYARDAGYTWNYFHEAQSILSRYDLVTIPPRPDLQTGAGKEASGWRRWFGFLSDWSQLFEFSVTTGLLAMILGTADRVTLFGVAIKTGPLISL